MNDYRFKNQLVRKFFQLFLLFVLVMSPTVIWSQYVTFSDVSQLAGVAEPDSGTGHGVVFADFNGDGLLDIYMVNWWYQPNFLFINNGNGTFTNRASDYGVTVPEGGDRGISTADFDNDGDMDMYISAGGRNYFFRNENNAHFTEIADGAGVSDWGQGMAVCFGDYDRDGYVDLLITNQGSGENQLFRNNGNGSFSKVTNSAGLGNYQYSNGAAFFDYDNDGYLDIFIARGRREQNYNSLLYHNNRNGTFTEVGASAGVGSPGDALGVAIGDYNNDGYLDIYITEEWQHNRLYRNNGNGTFTNVASSAGVADPGRNVGCTFGDFNNDGWLDIYETAYGGSNRLYRNNGDGTFTEVGGYAGVNDSRNGFGVTVGDYNRDGQLDIFLSNAGQKAKLFRNNGCGNHWIALKLVGQESNRSAIGARVNVFAGGHRQIREICGGSSYVAENSLEVYFGLAYASVVDSIIINWPSGITQRLYNVQANQYLSIVESSAPPTPPAPPAPKLSVSPRTLNFGYSMTSKNFHIANTGQEDLHWQIPSNWSAAWLVNVSPLSGENDADVSVQIDRSNLTPGLYKYILPIHSNAGDDSVQIMVKVTDSQRYNLKFIAGGHEYTDSNGDLWQADQAYSPGGWGYIEGHVYSNSNSIQGTDDPYLYQTERYGLTSYQFSVPNGKYLVILHFAEIFWHKTGKRVFDVAIEDSLVLDHYDIYSDVGENCAVSYSYVADVADGILNIDFTTWVDNSKVSAIEIIGMEENPTEPMPILDVSVDSLDLSLASTDSSFIIQNAGDGNLSWQIQTDSLPNWLTVYPPSGGNYDTVKIHIGRSGQLPGNYCANLSIVSNGGNKIIPVLFTIQGHWLSLFRINIGGDAYTDHAGNQWNADQQYSPGNWGYIGGKSYFKSIPIDGTVDDSLYQSERYNMDEYRFDIPNGYYQITLDFAEIFWKASGKRIFNLAVEGQPVLKDFDIYSKVGYARVFKKKTTALVADGQLNITFENIVDFGKLSALEIKALADSMNQPVLCVNPQILDFGQDLDQAYLHILNIASDTLNWEIQLDPDTVNWIANVSKYSGVNNDSVLFTIDRSNLEEGNYQTQFKVVSNGGNEVVTLKMQVADTTHYHICVNAGADTNYIDTMGNLFFKDQPYTPGDWGYSGGTPYFKDIPIDDTDDDELFRTERYGTFSYIFSVPNGSYQVGLNFAEIFWHDTGKRVFSVKINGQQVITDYDLVADVGYATATHKDFNVNVSDGQIRLDFVTTIDNAKISSIEISKNTTLAKNETQNVAESRKVPLKTRIVGNYPNPFNPVTRIQFDLATPSRVTFDVYNILGEKIRTLIANCEMEAGEHVITWNGENASGMRVPSGIYFCHLNAIQKRDQKMDPIDKTLKIVLSK